jgi:hypothetical protein
MEASFKDSFDLIECDLIIAAVVELRRGRTLARRHLLRLLQKSAVEQIDNDADRPECVEPSFVMIPACRARRTIIRRASSRLIRSDDNCFRPVRPEAPLEIRVVRDAGPPHRLVSGGNPAWHEQIPRARAISPSTSM